MDELRIGAGCDFELPHVRTNSWATVPLGYVSVVTSTPRLYGACGKLPNGTVVSGALFLAEMNRGEGRGEIRAIIRYTQATTPEGTVYPVCLEGLGSSHRDPGVYFKPGSSPGTIQLHSKQLALRVERFE
jgi:hypothetical protein